MSLSKNPHNCQYHIYILLLFYQYHLENTLAAEMVLVNKGLMPKTHDVIDKPKDIYIGVKYNETVEPNEIQILGSITRSEILKYPVEQNKGAPYYKVPLSELVPIDQNTFGDTT